MADRPADVERAYRAVRSGRENILPAGDDLFCSTTDGLVVTRLKSRGTDDWADKFRDQWLQDEVKNVLSHDRHVAGESIRATVEEGEAILVGRVGSDSVALLAIDDALAVDGVVAVRAELLSPQSASPAARSGSAYCSSSSRESMR